MKLDTPKKVYAAEIANRVIARIREGNECSDYFTKGAYHDISGQVHSAIFYTILEMPVDELVKDGANKRN